MDKTTDAAQNGRKIIEKNGRRLLTVSSTEDLKIISSIQRQRIFKLLKMADKPLHGKEIADNTGMKAPSAHFHLRKLVEIGAVGISHTQIINGIIATYYEPAVDDIITGEEFLSSSNDEEIQEKLLFAARVFNEAKGSFVTALDRRLQDKESALAPASLTLLINEVLYLSSSDINCFHQEMDALMKKYSGSDINKQPYSFFMSIADIKKP